MTHVQVMCKVQGDTNKPDEIASACLPISVTTAVYAHVLTSNDGLYVYRPQLDGDRGAWGSGPDRSQTQTDQELVQGVCLTLIEADVLYQRLASRRDALVHALRVRPVVIYS